MTDMPLSRRHALALLAAAAATPLGAHAQANYPEKPVTLVVGYSAGGAVDAVARTLGQAMSSAMGQPFVIENKPGAGTNIAVKYVIDAKPYGYTVLMADDALGD